MHPVLSNVDFKFMKLSAIIIISIMTLALKVLYFDHIKHGVLDSRECFIGHVKVPVTFLILFRIYVTSFV